jgi:hypothetical protein
LPARGAPSDWLRRDRRDDPQTNADSDTLPPRLTCRASIPPRLRCRSNEPDPKELTTLTGKWRTGDAAQRWELLNTLFERIHIRQHRKVEGYTPRADRANRVRLLINTAFDYVYGSSEREAEGPGAEVANRLGLAEGERFELSIGLHL